MPAPGPGGVQTSLVGRVQGMMAATRAAFGRKPGAPVQSPGDKNNPPDLTQFKETFQPEVAPGAITSSTPPMPMDSLPMSRSCCDGVTLLAA
jgi:hypothetical protein